MISPYPIVYSMLPMSNALVPIRYYTAYFQSLIF
jgi:hypothetical protein